MKIRLTLLRLAIQPRYLDDLLNIDNIYFDQIVDRIYPTELQLNRANSSDTEASFLDLNLCISYSTVSAKIYDKRDDFDFDIVNYPFLDGDVPRRGEHIVYHWSVICRPSSSVHTFKNIISSNTTGPTEVTFYSIFKITRMDSMIPKEIKYNLHYDDVQGDIYGRHTAKQQLQQSKIKDKKDCFWKQRIHKVTKSGDSV